MIEIKIDTLYEAIRIQTAIELRLEGSKNDSEDVLFFSKFMDYSEENQLILIDFPTVSEALGALRENDPVVVKFFHKDSPFIFNSTIMDLSGTNFDGRRKRQMAISLPPAILGEERRNFLKVRTPPYEVSVKLTGSSDLLRQIKGGKYTAVVVNISGGGIGLENPEKNLPFAPGDILDLNIHLPDHPIRIEGEVLNVYSFDESEKKSFGIRFFSKNIDKREYNKNVRTIVRYVMRRERELLSK